MTTKGRRLRHLAAASNRVDTPAPRRGCGRAFASKSNLAAHGQAHRDERRDTPPRCVLRCDDRDGTARPFKEDGRHAATGAVRRAASEPDASSSDLAPTQSRSIGMNHGQVNVVLGMRKASLVQ